MRKVEPRIYTLKDIDTVKWNELVMMAKNGTVFNTIEWAKVWDTTFKNTRPIFIISNNLNTGMPVIEIQKAGFKSYYSMPYGNYGGIIVRSQNSEIGTQKLKILSEFAKLAKGRWGMLGISDFYNELETYKLDKLGFKKIKSTTHILLLSADPDIIWQNYLTPSKRRLVNQSQRSGVKIAQVKEADIPECYSMLCATAKKHGQKTARFPINFYFNLFKFMNNFLKWDIAKKGDEPIANTIHFVYKDTITYWDGGSYEYGLKYRPNDALIWECIKWGSEKNYKFYDLGGSPPTAKGLAKFKESWGAKERHFYFYYKQSITFKTLKLIQQLI